LAVSSALSPTAIPQDQHLALARGERPQQRAEPLGEFLGEQALLGAVVQHWSLGQLCRNVARDGGWTPSSSRTRIVSDLLGVDDPSQHQRLERLIGDRVEPSEE
jgi:hypothetical protein